jgi:hypothetical protein
LIRSAGASCRSDDVEAKARSAGWPTETEPGRAGLVAGVARLQLPQQQIDDRLKRARRTSPLSGRWRRVDRAERENAVKLSRTNSSDCGCPLPALPLDIYRKLDVANRTEASRWQIHGLLSTY